MYSTFLSVRAFSIITVILLAHYCLCVCFLSFFKSYCAHCSSEGTQYGSPASCTRKEWRYIQHQALNLRKRSRFKHQLYRIALSFVDLHVQPHIHRRQCITSSWKTIEHFHGFEGGAVKELLSTSFSLNKYGLMPVRHQPRLSQIVSSFLTSCWI